MSTGGVNFDRSQDGIPYHIIPESFERQITHAMAFDRYCWLSFGVADQFYGAAFFGLRQEQADPPVELLHFASWMFAIALRRRHEEETLRTMVTTLEKVEEIANLGHYELNFAPERPYGRK
jgi:hypothetical protein